jgi:hypothetical protein
LDLHHHSSALCLLLSSLIHYHIVSYELPLVAICRLSPYLFLFLSWFFSVEKLKRQKLEEQLTFQQAFGTLKS